ncbi:MAG: major facilitator superfamily transporter [Acidobacteriales bacterium]|nr:major facilitator superfamily transporter [Terriglobales bacterium]
MGHRGLRLIFIANMISMLGSGLNASAVIWHIFQQTRSEMNLAYLVVLQTVPAMLLLPFSGVVIDREDRRRMVMMLDVLRGTVIACVTVLVFTHKVKLWHLYLMNMLVAAGFWMFWPTITALIQELTPDSEIVHSNTFLMAGVQGGWLIAGAIVGFLYNHIGLGGILLIDVLSYVASFLLYFGVRKGKHIVERPEHVLAHLEGIGGAVSRYVHELQEGFQYLRARPSVVLLGISWSLFLGAMLTQGVVTAPLSDRILHAGAIGYGRLNGAWGIGAFLSALFAAKFIFKFTARATVAMAMAALALGMFVAPFSGMEWIAVGFFLIMGTARGLGGISITSSMMESVPKYMMGRVQNTFFFVGTLLQLVLGTLVGIVAYRYSLTGAFGIIGIVYVTASVLAVIPVAPVPTPVESKEAEPAELPS